MSVRKPNHNIRRAVLAALASAAATQAFAQDSGESVAALASGVADLEQVIVTGTRRAERSVADSAVPVDIVSKEDLQRTVSPDLNNKIQALVPSFNVRRLPLSDGAIFNRPATLRSLAPDQTLVLVNGKRRHRSAFVDVTDRGAQAVDLAQIPQIAIKRVEVLRDGASAQYGSDAIAGVINLILEDEPGSSGYAQFGEYSEHDGRNLQGAFRAGFGLADRGSLNLSMEYFHGDATSRSIQRPQAEALIALGEPYASTVRQPVVQRFGQPDIENYRFFYNGKFSIGDSTELYSFGNYSEGEGINDFNWRPPAAAGGFAQSSAYNRSRYQNGADALYPDWDLRSVYPGGFTPLFSAEQQDYGAVLGVRGDFSSSLSWDLSGSHGYNRIKYFLYDSINASLGPQSPTDFYDGARSQTEDNVNLEFVYQWQTGLEKPVNVAFGAEFRREEFEISPGDEASYIVGPLRDLSPASNGFPGASPVQSGAWARDNTAVYVDVDADINDRWNIGVAGRYEDYSTFGSTSNGKLSTRFRVTDTFSLRAAASTGFRAPTPGQANLTNTSQFPDAATQTVVTRGTLPPTSAVAQLFGGTELQPEKAENISAGFVLTPLAGLSLSVDVYQIDVDDRIGITQDFIITPLQQAALIAAGVPGAADLTQVNFFTNGYDTRTRGIDAVASFRDSVGAGQLGLVLAYNHNDTEITASDPGIVSVNLEQSIEQRLPGESANLSVNYTIGKWDLFTRGRYFGDWLSVSSTTGNDTSLNQRIGAELFVDLAATYDVTDQVKVTVGAENLLDAYPDKALYNTFVGRVYNSGPYDTDGRQAYLRASVTF